MIRATRSLCWPGQDFTVLTGCPSVTSILDSAVAVLRPWGMGGFALEPGNSLAELPSQTLRPLWLILFKTLGLLGPRSRGRRSCLRLLNSTATSLVLRPLPFTVMWFPSGLCGSSLPYGRTCEESSMNWAKALPSPPLKPQDQHIGPLTLALPISPHVHCPLGPEEWVPVPLLPRALPSSCGQCLRPQCLPWAQR